MNSDQARQRAEKRFKQEERARDGQKAMIEYEVQARATREKMSALSGLIYRRDESPTSTSLEEYSFV